jgi:transcriptional regulator with XRE-family HTH domain
MNYREADRILSCVMDKLEQERVRQGLSLQKLGEISGVHRTTIGMIEKGERSPSLVICLRLADALGIPLWEVLKNVPATKGGRRK